MQASDPSDDHRLDPNNPFHPLPEDSPLGTIAPRYFAAVGDNLLAVIGALVVAKQFPDSLVALQVAAMVTFYLGYYLVSEGIFCTTPGKYLTGLTIRDFDGGRCSFRQALVRTLFRFIEVNPFLLGGLPAGIRILCSRDKQRFGDKFARTVVVRR